HNFSAAQGSLFERPLISLRYHRVTKFKGASRNMRKRTSLMHLFVGLGAAAGLSLTGGLAQAGGFSVREQSAYFLGSAFAGSAAGTDISSMYWNSAATAAKTGCNASVNMSAIFGSSEEPGQAGLFVTGTAAPVPAPGLSPTSTDVARSSMVPASYATCQLTDRLYAGLGINAPFGLTTKPDSVGWAGSPIGITSKI